MKIISWNVNGIRACFKRNCLNPIGEEIKPDIFCIQETKAHPGQVDNLLSEFPHHFWNAAEKAGYAGTATFSKIKPLQVSYGMGIKEHDQEGRIVNLEFQDYFLVNVYVPNSGRGLPRLSYRAQWDKDFLSFLKKLERKKPIVVCGDFNVARTRTDLANPDSNYNKTAGFTQVEINGFQKFFEADFIDTFREFHKEPGQYTYWGYWNNLRARNIGWRIDYFLISSSLQKKLKKAFILKEIMGSDHCPIGIVLS
ncbi:exodeoxyribonuclease III [Candidatus Woesearchaeota archaeon]|nr:exodeoxyribonuclease III [Candidatus Woesearchaeota archaeon]